jgi:hypothetical protein
MLPPDHESFDEAMRIDTFDSVRSRQFHHHEHLPGCFEYRLKKCQLRFPRKLIPKTVLDEFTGIILQKRDHELLNNYNP